MLHNKFFSINIVKPFAVLPLVVTGLLATTGQADAAKMYGNYQIGSFVTEIDLSKDLIDFNVSDVGTMLGATSPEVSVTAQQFDPDEANSFTNYKSAFIYDIGIQQTGVDQDGKLTFDLTEEVNPFLDFSLGSPSPLSVNTEDGEDIFRMQKITGFSYRDVPGSVGGGVTFDLFFSGVFENGGDLTKGTGNLTFQAAGVSADDVTAALAGNQVLTGLTFSGSGGIKTVPEPGTILGLLAIGGLVTSTIRKREQ